MKRELIQIKMAESLKNEVKEVMRLKGGVLKGADPVPVDIWIDRAWSPEVFVEKLNERTVITANTIHAILIGWLFIFIITPLLIYLAIAH